MTTSNGVKRNFKKVVLPAFFVAIFVLGFAGGFAFQGIYCYNDWYKFIIRKKS